MKKTTASGTRWAACAFVALLLALWGLTATRIEEAHADQRSIPSGEATTDVDGEPFVSGQAIACIVAGSEDRLSQVADSVEFLLALDAQTSGCGPCDLVLVKSSSRTVEDLIASLEAHEDVVFAEPNYLEEKQAEDNAEHPEELQLEVASEVPEKSRSEDAANVSEDLQLEDASDVPGEPQLEDAADNLGEPQPENAVSAQDDMPPTVASNAAPRPDYTSRQYAFNGEFGIGVPNWNTYDSVGNPTPSPSTEGKVVAVVDTGIDYNHEDLRGVMWDEGESHPSLVALGGGPYGINVAPPRSDGTLYDTTDPQDDSNHGTHVAGIVAGEWNGFGISGVTSGARLMAVKVMNDKGANDMGNVLQGYRYIITALKAGVDVAAINNSWDFDVYSKSLDMAVREAGRLGAVTVFAAGNDGRDIDMIGQMTNALANNPYVVVVGNSDESGQVPDTSSFGKRSVDVFAPGDRIFSTLKTGTGPGDETADPLEAGGITYACDYESTVVRDNADNSVFGFSGGEGTTLAIADEGHDASAHSLSLSAAAGEELTITLSSKPLAVGSECRGMCLWLKAPAVTNMRCMVVCETADGATREQLVELKQASDEWRVLAVSIADDASKDKLELQLTIMVYEWQGATKPTILIDDVKLTSETAPYEYEFGTSMATPAVAGSAAVLAATFPNDDAAERAARIIGSVKPIGDMADLCVSGGIFRLDKALGQDTGPVLNGASTQADTVTIEGFFFGEGPGSISFDEQALAVVSWSDTSIVAQLPSDFSPGEKLVHVMTGAGKEGHQSFRIDTPVSLYQRLPLPGRTLSGEPGDYEIASSEFDESFYGTIPRALVGLGGRLYYLLETVDGQGSIFCYDIDAQTWEKVYEGAYAPGGGACTWAGKILFVAGEPREDNTYLGVFDPTTRTAEYSLYNDQCFERECTIVNTGKGILLAGGRDYKYSDVDESAIEAVRTIDPESLTVSTVSMPQDVVLSDYWYASAYDEEGNGYLFGGADLSGFYKFTFAEGGVTCNVLEEGPILGGGGTEGLLAQSAHAEGTVADWQLKNMVAGPTKSGIIASGPVMVNDAGVVTADTYTLDWGGTEFRPTDKLMSVTRMFNAAGTTYRGRFYVIGASESEVGGWVFASQPVETFEQPGDVPGPSDPTRPADPTNPTDSSGSTSPSGSRSGDSSNGQQVAAHPTGQSNPSAPQTSSTPKLPVTGDVPLTSAPFLVVLGVTCLIVACCKRADKRTG